MAVSMSIENANGEFVFDVEENDMPRFGREVEYIRLDPQGPSFRRVLITLTGQWLEHDNPGVMAKYDALCEVLKYNDVNFSYNDGTVAHYEDRNMYVERYTEPEEWKEYDGTWTVQFYYFEAHDASLPINVTYGGYQFEHVPTWQRKITPTRQNIFTRETPGGQTFGSIGEVQLRGILTADQHTSLATKIDALEAALENDDTLTYGSFTQQVAMMSHSITETVPDTQAFFTIDFQYLIGDIVTLSSRVRFTRLHRNPVITEMALCNQRFIEFMNLSGQYIDYAFTLQAATISQCRSMLVTEVSNAVFAGGFEVDGGSEEWNNDNISVNLLIKKFYNNYVSTNIQPIPFVLFEGQFDPAG